ncbi:MAG: hypothetical protein RSA87_03710 [Malacoplasma sp.]
MAARDAGNLLKKVLEENKSKYYESRQKHTKEYLRIKKERYNFLKKQGS